MLKFFETLWLIMAISATVMIFSFSANDAQESSAQSKVIANKVVDIIEQATD